MRPNLAPVVEAVTGVRARGRCRGSARWGRSPRARAMRRRAAARRPARSGGRARAGDARSAEVVLPAPAGSSRARGRCGRCYARDAPELRESARAMLPPEHRPGRNDPARARSAPAAGRERPGTDLRAGWPRASRSAPAAGRERRGTDLRAGWPRACAQRAGGRSGAPGYGSARSLTPRVRAARRRQVGSARERICAQAGPAHRGARRLPPPGGPGRSAQAPPPPGPHRPAATPHTPAPTPRPPPPFTRPPPWRRRAGGYRPGRSRQRGRPCRNCPFFCPWWRCLW
jgi:hypothetical protein